MLFGLDRAVSTSHNPVFRELRVRKGHTDSVGQGWHGDDSQGQLQPLIATRSESDGVPSLPKIDYLVKRAAKPLAFTRTLRL
jgi:hypothetical protein